MREDRVEVLYPRGTIPEQRPRFLLGLPAGIEGCRITLNAMMGMGPKVIARIDADSPVVPYPEEAMDLPRGAIAWFSVAARRGGAPEAEVEGETVIASEAMVRELTLFRQEVESLRGRDSRAAAFAEAALLIHRGFFFEAIRSVRREEGSQPLLRDLLARHLQLTEVGAREVLLHLFPE